MVTASSVEDIFRRLAWPFERKMFRVWILRYSDANQNLLGVLWLASL